MSGYYDRQGQPVTQDEWWRAFEDPEYQRVALYEEGGYVVSTVWLGLDHSFGEDSPPLIFETLVLRGYDGEELMYRCSTEDEAYEQHARVVSMLESAPLEDLA